MSYGEKDDCDVARRLKLEEINQKASAKARKNPDGIDTSGTLCEVISMEEMLAAVNSGASPQHDAIREQLIQHLIDNDIDA